MLITFTIPGNPVGKGRPRVSSRHGFARMYTPEKTASYENLVAMAAHDAMAGQPLVEGAVRATLHAYCAIPASWSKKKQALALAGELRPTTKPDLDNVVKAVFDAMNGVVWRDDVQVVALETAKHYSDTPRVWVEVVPA